ncbi:thymidylate kinase [Corynebacterium renale]|uniref:dTMP kinase n=1 Tax=Corynebacterium renale TaxID=1724 RepID=UPI000DA29134|nr:dTMP kinase [Corynebacterium renale]SQG64176.1 thymidylate kinase [Corynebacterium renale]STC94511.1 thymidylate kinase [Corynebacterium renale]
MIIAVEGIDGAGKNTLVSAVSEAFQGVEVVSFPQYGKNAPARLVQRALYGKMGDLTESVYGMATMFALDRHAAVDYLNQFAAGGARSHDILLCDRYVASNAAYSMARLHDLDPNGAIATWTKDVEFTELGLPVPDLQVLLDTSPEVAAQRAQHREKLDARRTRDEYEKDAGLQDRTFAAYQVLAQNSWASPWLVTSSAEELVEQITSLRAAR